MTLTEAVRTAVEKYPIGYEFGLWDLKRDVLKIYPQSKYTHADTVSRRMREVRHGKDYEIICVKPLMSRYVKMNKQEAKAWLKAKNKKPKHKRLFITRAA